MLSAIIGERDFGISSQEFCKSRCMKETEWVRERHIMPRSNGVVLLHFINWNVSLPVWDTSSCCDKGAASRGTLGLPGVASQLLVTHSAISNITWIESHQAEENPTLHAALRFSKQRKPWSCKVEFVWDAAPWNSHFCFAKHQESIRSRQGGFLMGSFYGFEEYSRFASLWICAWWATPLPNQHSIRARRTIISLIHCVFQGQHSREYKQYKHAKTTLSPRGSSFISRTPWLPLMAFCAKWSHLCRLMLELR